MFHITLIIYLNFLFVGEITLNVSRTSATLDSEMQQVSLQLGTPATEDCIQGVRYRISYTYNGPTSYSVIFTVNGSVVITVDDIGERTHLGIIHFLWLLVS